MCTDVAHRFYQTTKERPSGTTLTHTADTRHLQQQKEAICATEISLCYTDFSISSECRKITRTARHDCGGCVRVPLPRFAGRAHAVSRSPTTSFWYTYKRNRLACASKRALSTAIPMRIIKWACVGYLSGVKVITHLVFSVQKSIHVEWGNVQTIVAATQVKVFICQHC